MISLRYLGYRAGRSYYETNQSSNHDSFTQNRADARVM